MTNDATPAKVRLTDGLGAGAEALGYSTGINDRADWSQLRPDYWIGYLRGMVDGRHAATAMQQAELAVKCIQRGVHRDVIRDWQGLPPLDEALNLVLSGRFAG